MNEADTRAECIDPLLQQSGWDEDAKAHISREYPITNKQGRRGTRRYLKADYILSYKNVKLAVIEAKRDETPASDGVAQAKQYAEKLGLDYAYATNGREIYQICMKSGDEGPVSAFPTPNALWDMVHQERNLWRDKFNQVPFETGGSAHMPRFYQEIAVNRTMEAIANKKTRLLLTLATGSGKTYIAFQIAWKLFQTRWNIQWDGSRRPRILFLVDRNILADQAFNAFSAFADDALVRISPNDIRTKGRVPINGSVFFTIFQTFMSGVDSEENLTPYFGEYPADFFDFIIIDECHRGGANDDSRWRGILEYFSPAVQLGLTATPKNDENANTYRYFGNPLYVYSLREGIDDGYLVPYRVRRTTTTIDSYIYAPDDAVIAGEIDRRKEYEEKDFSNRKIEINLRNKKRVEILLNAINQNEKCIVFCADQNHARTIRDLINQQAQSNDPNYCHRVTADDDLGDQHLRDFQDNEKSIPTILTTSRKLSTGVDATNIRNIVLFRRVKSLIEFKQIIGRGTRLHGGKAYFTLYDFVGAYQHFLDPEWDGDPEDIKSISEPGAYPPMPSQSTSLKERTEHIEAGAKEKSQMIKIALADGKEREIQHTMKTLFWSSEGAPISAEEFLQLIFGALPRFYTTEQELCALWSQPSSRNKLLVGLEAAGFSGEDLRALQKLVNAEKSDLFDVLEYISFASPPITREQRVNRVKARISRDLDPNQQDFVNFVLSKYIDAGVDELEQDKMPALLELKYGSTTDAKRLLGSMERIRALFVAFQKHLYSYQPT